MDGEIDLELYTISMIRLNSIFQKIEDDEIVTDIISDIDDCFNDLNQLYEEKVSMNMLLSTLNLII